MVVVNDLEDEKGAARIVAKPEDALALFPMAAKDDDGVREISRGFMFVMRALESHDHDEALIPTTDTGGWKKPKDYKLQKLDAGWKVTGLDILWNRAFMQFELEFDASRRLKAAKPIDTGER